MGPLLISIYRLQFAVLSIVDDTAALACDSKWTREKLEAFNHRHTEAYPKTLFSIRGPSRSTDSTHVKISPQTELQSQRRALHILSYTGRQSE
jgi:hypothetical protein